MNRNSYMNQNMNSNNRGMRNGNAYQGGMQTQRQSQNSYNRSSNSNTVSQRSGQNDCGCGNNSGRARIADIPTGDRTCLRNYIDEVSFAAYEAVLYLDTHPDCQEAMQFFRDHNEMRNHALKEYGKLYGPMTLMQAGENCDAYWQWVNQPWPWEGGNC